MSQEVASGGAVFGARGAGRWQGRPIRAMPGVCRAEKVMWELTRAGEGYMFALNRSQKWKFRLRAVGNKLKHIHLADNNRQAPGRGHIDFLEMVIFNPFSVCDGGGL